MNKIINYNEQYNIYLNLINNRLEEYLESISHLELYEPFKYIISGGGKRIRPVLTMISCGAVGGNTNEAVDAALALEILHNFTLVHDDIMDNSNLRRGQETVHIKWNDAVAILTGDIMIGYAYRLLDLYINHPNFSKIFNEFTDALIVVCEGQADDIDFDTNPNVKLPDYYFMINKKTAKLLESAVVIGALIGNANDEEIESLRYCAHNFGMAFQIQDDLLDLTADQAKLGKKIGQDVIEGKKTYLILKALELDLSINDKLLMNEFLENKGLDENEVYLMKELLERNGVLDTAQKDIDNYLFNAKQSIDNLITNDSAEMLNILLSKLNKRNS